MLLFFNTPAVIIGVNRDTVSIKSINSSANTGVRSRIQLILLPRASESILSVIQINFCQVLQVNFKIPRVGSTTSTEQSQENLIWKPSENLVPSIESTDIDPI